MKIRILVTVLLTMAICAMATLPRLVRLRWNPNSESDLAGYRIRYGPVSGEWNTEVDVGLATNCVLTVTNRPTFVHVIAYSSSGLQSDPSSEVKIDWPEPPAGFSASVTVVFTITNTVPVP